MTDEAKKEEQQQEESFEVKTGKALDLILKKIEATQADGEHMIMVSWSSMCLNIIR